MIITLPGTDLEGFKMEDIGPNLIVRVYASNNSDPNCARCWAPLRAIDGSPNIIGDEVQIAGCFRWVMIKIEPVELP